MPNDSDFRVGRENKPEVPKKWESASGGMVSTMSDFARFSQMLLDGGKFEGKTYLSPKAFELMTSDHIGPGSGVERDYFYFPGDGFGFGLGLPCAPIPATPSRHRRAIARRIEMGRCQRLLFRDRPQAGHVFRAAGADATSASASSGR